MTEEIVYAPITETGVFVGVCIGLIIFCILNTFLIINLKYSRKYKLDISLGLLTFTIITIVSALSAYYFFNKF